MALLPGLGFASVHAGSNETLHYKNQRGSTLTVVLHSSANHSGNVTGTFETAVASSNCQEDIGKSRPVTGFYAGNAISLSVSYPTCGSTISITGDFDKNRDIQTLWIVSHQAKQVAGKDWNSRYVGSDSFKLQN